MPGYTGHLKRPESIKMRAQDLEGQWHEYEFQGFSAVVNCHEYDHLDGILYTDNAEDLMTNEEYEELLREQAEKESRE